MSKRRRSRANSQLADVAAAAALILSQPIAQAQHPPEPAAAFAGFGRSGFDGANFSTRRGFIYFPTLETRREVDSFSRLELIRRSRWLKRNTGFARRCINGVSNMVGFLRPRPLTKDRDWNKAAEARWQATACLPAVFDLSRRFNVNSYQNLLTRSRLCDGDILSVFTSGPGNGAAVMTYEGHQIANGRGLIQDTSSSYRDGVKLDAWNGAVSYSVISDFETGDAVQIPAADAVLHADFDSFGWSRGVSALHHAVNNLLDQTEITSDLKLGIKNSSRIGYYLSTPQGQTGPTPGMRDAALSTLRKEQTAKGSNVLLEDTFRGGRLPELPAGVDIKMLLDQRPHPNTREFLEHLNRDISWGLGISSDVLWNIAKLGGASVRYVLADAQTWIESQQQLLVDQFLTRFWVYWAAKEMAENRLPPCDDPEWWLVGWLPPQRLTVDLSRDGKLSIDLHRAGMLTMKRFYGQQGLDDEEEDRQRVEEYARRMVLCAEVEARYAAEGKIIRIDPEKVFPTGIPGAAPAGNNGPQPPARVPDAELEAEGRFSDPEAVVRMEGKLDEILARFDERMAARAA